MRGLRAALLALSTAALVSCASAKPPSRIDDICVIFKEKRSWRRAVRKASRRWDISTPILMAFVKQESSFRGRVRPRLKKWVRFVTPKFMEPMIGYLPGTRLSDSKGYSQALRSTWDLYRKDAGRSRLARRTSFKDSVDFIGWYNDQSARRLEIARGDAYNLYMAYHEGWGGFERRTWDRKLWLWEVGRSVTRQARDYDRQLEDCG